jgi:hypothetical protein
MRRWTVLGSVVIACAVAPSWAHAAATDISQNDYTVEGEAMGWTPANGQALGDALAPDGTAYAASTNGTGGATVTTTHSTIRIAVSARGDQCQGAPHMVVSLDGAQVISADVANAGWYQEYAADLYAPAGQHTITIAYTNQLQVPGACDRRLWIDAAMLNGQPFSLSSYRNRPLDPGAPIDSGSSALMDSLMNVVGVSGTGPSGGSQATGVGGLLGLVGSGAAGGSPAPGVWMQTSNYTQPVYTVGASQAKIRVQLNGCPGGAPKPVNPPPCDPNLQGKLAAVPLPNNVQVYSSGGLNPQDTDSEVIVWQPSTDSEWSFWNLQRNSFGNWTAGWGDYMGPGNTQLSACPPGSPTPYSALSTSLSQSAPLIQPGNQCHNNWDSPGSQGSAASAIPTLMGLIRISEGRAVNRGQSAPIDHAIDFSLPEADVRAFDAPAQGQSCPYPLVPSSQSSNFPWPAQRTDGESSNCSSIPEGTRLRLPASLNIDALGLSPFAAAVAKAVQRYGMVLTDKNGTTSTLIFYGERAQSTSGPDPWRNGTGIFSRNGAINNPPPPPNANCSSSPKGVFCGFPFSQLQVVAVPAIAGQF